MDAVPTTSRRRTKPSAAVAILAALALATGTGCEVSGAGAFDDDADPDGGGRTDLAPVPGIPAPVAIVPPVGCDTENGSVSLLSPGDPGALAGPALARFLIRHGRRVTFPVRVGEFLGYYGFPGAVPAGERLAISAGLRPVPEATEAGLFELQIVLAAADLAASERPPLNLIFSFDTSSAMQGSPIQRVKQGCVALAAALRAGDVISLVGWDPDQEALLDSHPVGGPDDPVVVAHCNGLSAHGVAALGPALEAAYAIALANAAPGTTSRVILVSGGGLPVSVDDAGLIARMAAGENGAEIRLASAGVGSDATPDQYDTTPLAAAAAAGRGAHFFVDSAAEAALVFGQRLPAALEPAAEDPRVELSLPPTLRPLPEPAVADDGGTEPSRAPVLGFGGHAAWRRTISSCAPSALDPDGPLVVTARFEDPAGGGARAATLETTLAQLLGAEAAALAKGRAVAAWAEAVDDVRTLHGQAAIDRLEEAREIVGEAIDGFGNDPDLIEIDELIGLYRELF